MTEIQERLLLELKAAAEQRHGRPLRVYQDTWAIMICNLGLGPAAPEDVVEEYIWNAAGNLLIRVVYVVWEHIVGEDHEWGRFGTQRAAEARIAALFSSGSLGAGEYYITRLYTTRPLA